MNRKSKFAQSVTALYCQMSIEGGPDKESMSILKKEQDALVKRDQEIIHLIRAVFSPLGNPLIFKQGLEGSVFESFFLKGKENFF